MHRLRADHGATTVEAAIVLPILMIVLFGIIEIGGSLKTYSSTSGAVRSAGRVASIAGSDPMADATILSRIVRDVGTDNGQVQLVVIWHATGQGDPVPAGCLPAEPFVANTSSVGVSDGGTDAVGACNVYILPGAAGGTFAMASGTATYAADHYFGCSGLGDPDAGQKVDCNWPGMNRRVLTSPRGAVSPEPSDFVGIYIRTRHSYYTGIFGTTLTITDRGISLIEPQGYDPS